MKGKKSAPTIKNVNVKSKTNKVHISRYKNTNNIKPVSVPMSAVDSLKRQYVKRKTELQRQTSEQTERPENYAVDEVDDKAESAAYAAADTVRQSARYVKRKIQQHRTERVNDIPVPDIPAQEPVQPQMLNDPKTAVLQAENKPVPQEQIKVKKTDIKTKDSYIRSHIRSVTDIKAKSSGTEVNPHIISQDKRSIKHEPKNTIKSVSEKTSPVKPVRKVRIPKIAQRTVNKSAKQAAVKTQKQVTKQVAKQAAKRSKELARRSTKAAKAAVKTTVKVTVKIAQAVAAATKAIVSALAALGGWAVLLVVLIIVIIIAAKAVPSAGTVHGEVCRE